MGREAGVGSEQAQSPKDRMMRPTGAAEDTGDLKQPAV